MATYIIKEVQDVNSEREGTQIEAKNLSAAKRSASRGQFYQGTVLKIESESGVLLAYKEAGKSWVNYE